VEELVTGEVGFLVSPGNVVELTEAIQALVAIADQGRVLGMNGHDRVLAHFDARKIARELSDLFSGCRETRRS
jgi:glycosyltransferase involved in cell wall biosynthesis